MIEPVHLTAAMQPGSDAYARDFNVRLLACSLRHMNLATNSALRSVEHLARLLHANTHSEIMELSHDYCEAQMDILNRQANCTTDFICEIARQTAEPFRENAILPCSVIL